MFKKRVLAVFVILQVVVTSMFPASAYAATYQPNVHEFWGVNDFWAVNGVSNRFDAALGLIGEWGKKIQISNANYIALSNASSGGAFYELAQLLQTAPGEWEPGPDLGFNPIANIAWAGLYTETQVNYGDPSTWLWYCYASDANIADARRDFLKVLAGESLGGGGGGGSGGYYEYEIKVRYVTSGWVTYFNDGLFNKVKSDGTVADGAALAPPAMYVKIPAEFIDAACTKLGSGYSAANTFIVFERTSKGGSGGIRVIFNSTACDVRTRSGKIGSLEYQYYDVAYSPNKYTSVSDSSFVFGGYTLTADYFDAALANRTNFGNNINNSNPYDYQMVGVQSGGGGGGGGDNHWPEPTTPEPDPPTNTDPPLDPPDPPGFTVPDIDLPDPEVDLPITIVPPDNTTAADYTPWLRAILTALNTIIDDMGEHCDHIRVAMRDYLNGLYEALSDDLQAYYDDLTDYMSDLAKWIVSHLNFDIKQPDINIPGYDDSSVVGWLRRIYYKLRGTGSPRPDPIEDTDGALDWWSKFLEWITNALGGLLTDFVGDLGGFLQELMDTFPFSIPWDIVAMLTLLDAQRATPDVTFTIPGQNGWWNDITIRINLSAYDDAMATVRGMVLIWWMYILVMKTDWMMLLFDGANNAIGDFVSRLTGKG